MGQIKNIKLHIVTDIKNKKHLISVVSCLAAKVQSRATHISQKWLKFQHRNLPVSTVPLFCTTTTLTSPERKWLRSSVQLKSTWKLSGPVFLRRLFKDATSETCATLDQHQLQEVLHQLVVVMLLLLQLPKRRKKKRRLNQKNLVLMTIWVLDCSTNNTLYMHDQRK